MSSWAERTGESIRRRSLECGLETFRRLAGFTNRKPERLLPNGSAPFVRLRQFEGRTYNAAPAFLEEMKSLADKAAALACEPDGLATEIE